MTQLTERQQALLRDLKSWVTIQSLVVSIDDEDELMFLMQAEAQGGKRLRVLNRLYSRYSLLRKDRELRDLASFILPRG